MAQYTAFLCLWVLPLPSPHLPFCGSFSPFCGPSHSEGMDIDYGEIGATLMDQEELLPMAPLGIASAEQPLVEENRIVEHLFPCVCFLLGGSSLPFLTTS